MKKKRENDIPGVQRVARELENRIVRRRGRTKSRGGEGELERVSRWRSQQRWRSQEENLRRERGRRDIDGEAERQSRDGENRNLKA